MGQQRERQHFGRAVLRNEARCGHNRVVRVAADGVRCVVSVFGGQDRGQVPDIGAPRVAGYVKLRFLDRRQSLQAHPSLRLISAQAVIREQ